MVGRKKTAAIYVLPEFVKGRETNDAIHNVPYRILLDNYDALPEQARKSFDAYRKVMGAEIQRVGNWGREFLRCYFSGEVLPDMKGTVHTDDRGTWGHAMLTLAAVADSKGRGVTVYEAKQYAKTTSNSVSGHLSKLHEAGVIVRLKKRR